MKDIDLDLQHDRLWGVDPGMTDMFVAADGHEDERHDVRKTSTREFYHMAGWNKAKRLEEKWKTENAGIQAILAGMPSAKTTSVVVFDVFVSYVLGCYKDLVEFYDERWRVQRFWSYRGRQMAMAEVCRWFTTGSKKYGVRPGTSLLLDPEPPDPGLHVKWKCTEPHDEPRRIVVAFGDGMFSPTMKGKKSGLSRVLFRAFRHHDRLGHLTLIKVPEFRTSKVCFKCQTLTLEHVRERFDDDEYPGNSLHAVIKCKNCTTVWNRDINAARNIRFVALYMANNENWEPDISILVRLSIP